VALCRRIDVGPTGLSVISGAGFYKYFIPLGFWQEAEKARKDDMGEPGLRSMRS
jgi:hypothetical protein